MLYFKYRKFTPIYIILLAVFFYFPQKIFSDNLEQVKTLKSFLEKKGNLFLFKIDNLDGENPWKIKNSTSYINKTEFVPKFPDLDGFELETESFKEIFNSEDKSSLMVHTYLEIPEREKVKIEPYKKILLPKSVPVRMFLWVHSENLKCELKAIFKSTKNPNQLISLGELNFTGWKRLEKRISIFTNYPRLIREKDRVLFKGLVLECGKRQKKGIITFYLDRISILMENSTPHYPGSEIQDGWTLK